MLDSHGPFGPKGRNDVEPLIPKHGGYRKLKSFQIAQLIYDVTVRFCNRYVDKYSRTHDQMVQAARSGVQNIAEGSVASGTSKKTELKLTNVARASLEELRLDYEDFLRQRKMALWVSQNPLRRELVSIRCTTADEVAIWVRQVAKRSENDQKHDEQSKGSIKSISSKSSMYAEISANAVLVLIAVTTALLDHQIAALAAAFKSSGGFSERLYRIRQNRRSGS